MEIYLKKNQFGIHRVHALSMTFTMEDEGEMEA